jgi:hypothetical protein
VDINPHSYAHLIFNKGAKTYDGEKTASLKMLLEKVDSCLQKTEIRSMFITLY